MGYQEDFVAERNWWQRASVVSTLPRPIVREFLDIKRRFGTELANLLLYLYREYGTAVARRFYRRLADKESLVDALAEVERYLGRFEPESRRALANYIIYVLYSSGVEAIHDVASAYAGRYPGLAERATRAFQELFRRGQYFSPECVVAYVIRRYYGGADAPSCRRGSVEEVARHLEGAGPNL